MTKQVEKLLGLKEVLEIVSVTKNTIYRMMRKEEFPTCRHISEGRICWRQSEIEKWIEAQWTKEK